MNVEKNKLLCGPNKALIRLNSLNLFYSLLESSINIFFFACVKLQTFKVYL